MVFAFLGGSRSSQSDGKTLRGVDMRAERAEMGAMGIWREESGAEYGGEICALSRAERERGRHKKNTLPRDIGILLFCLIDFC